MEADEEKEMSSENKAAQAVEKVFTQSDEQNEVIEEDDHQMESKENETTSWYFFVSLSVGQHLFNKYGLLFQQVISVYFGAAFSFPNFIEGIF